MKVYHSDINNPRLVVFIIAVTLLVVGVAPIDNMGAAEQTLMTSIRDFSIIAFGLYLFLQFIALLLPVKVSEKFIRCYNLNGLYQTVLWEDMNVAYLKKIYGLPYVFVEVNNQISPITVPLYLRDMKCFSNYVQTVAGPENCLSIFLSNETK